MFLFQQLVIFIWLNDRVLAKMEGFVVGGANVSIAQYPHSAFLDISCPSTIMSSWICGSSIINQHFTLTAAHCLSDCTRTGHVYVTVGHENRDKGVSISAYKFKIHESYDEISMEADIALVRLKTPFKFGPKVQRVILMRNPPRENLAYVSGWGLIDEVRQINTKQLKHTKQTLWPTEQCKKYLHVMPVATICAGSIKGNNYASGGDSGSALVIRGHIQIGIVSYKEPHVTKSLVVYVEVSRYINWITNSTRNMYCG